MVRNGQLDLSSPTLMLAQSPTVPASLRDHLTTTSGHAAAAGRTTHSWDWIEIPNGWPDIDHFRRTLPADPLDS
jgi:hypothetical protein